jgi:hypothetical protein
MYREPDPLDELRELVVLTDSELARSVMHVLKEAHVHDAEFWPEDMLTRGMLGVPQGPFRIRVPERSLVLARSLLAQAGVPDAQRPPES